MHDDKVVEMLDLNTPVEAEDAELAEQANEENALYSPVPAKLIRRKAKLMDELRAALRGRSFELLTGSPSPRSATIGHENLFAHDVPVGLDDNSMNVAPILTMESPNILKDADLRKLQRASCTLSHPRFFL